MNFHLDLDTETVDHAHPEPPLCVSPTASVAEVLDLLKQEDQVCALICRDEILVGIFTERDAVGLLAADADLTVAVEQVMIPDVVQLSTGDTVKDAITRMSQGRYRQLPIVDAAGKPTGLLKVDGILHYLVEHFPKVIYTLPPDPHHTTQEREGA